MGALVVYDSLAAWLGAALEAAAPLEAATLEGALQQPLPSLTLRVCEAPPAAGAPAVALCSIDVLLPVGSAHDALPYGAPAVSKLLLSAARSGARAWAVALDQHGCSSVCTRTLNPHETACSAFSFSPSASVGVADEDVRWKPQLAAAHGEAVPDELRGCSGFEVELSFRGTKAPPLGEVVSALTALLRDAELLAPEASIRLEVTRYAQLPPLADADTPQTDAPLPALEEATAAAWPGGRGVLRDRLPFIAQQRLAQEGVVQVGIGCATAEVTSGGRRATFKATVAAVARQGAAGETEAAAVAPPSVVQPASVHMFRDHEHLRHGLATLDYIRSKKLATAWKAAYGMVLLGADHTDASPLDVSMPACTLRFAPPRQEADTTPRLGLLIIHIRQQTPRARWAAKPPALWRKREAALVKTALSLVMSDLMAVSGVLTPLALVLKPAIPAIAAACAKIAAAADAHGPVPAAASRLCGGESQPTAADVHAAVLAALEAALRRSEQPGEVAAPEMDDGGEASMGGGTPARGRRERSPAGSEERGGARARAASPDDTADWLL